MTSRAFFHLRFYALAGLALLPAACAAEGPSVDAEARISGALALPGAVVFRTEGDPLDAAPAAGAGLPLADALRRAVATSPELQAALARVRAAQADADLARLLPNPVLNVVFRFPEGGGRTAIEAGLGADLRAVLERPRRASAAGARLEAEAAAALAAALDVVAEVQELYGGAQALERLLPLLAGRLDVLDRLRAVADARLELGEGTRADAAALAAERLELELDVAQRRQELRLLRLALARRIGEPSSAAAWELDPWRAPAPVPLEEPAWIAAALAARPEVQALERELRARGDEAALAGSAVWEGAALGADAEREDDWSVGPSAAVPLPIFGGSARTERAEALAAETRHRLTATRRGVVEEVRAALAGLGAAQDALARVAGELVPLQAERRAAVEEAFRIGQVDVTALLFAEQAQGDAEVRRAELERDVARELVRLERAVGGPAVLAQAPGSEGDAP